MRAVLLVVLLGLVTMASAQQSSLRAVATTAEVMSAIVVPSSTAVFKAAADAPKTDSDWATLRAQALVLAESGNLLMIGSRARDAGAWTLAAAALRDTADAVVKAVGARNATTLADAGDRVYETCEQCHSRYFPPPPSR